MSAAKHEAAPWWETDSGVRNADGYICHFNTATRYEGQDERYEREKAERAASKRLIAAAPELVEAGQEVAAAWQELAAALPQDDRIEALEWGPMQRLRAAIAKGTGSAS